MFTLNQHGNVDAVLMRLLKKLNFIATESVVSRLEKNLDYPSRLSGSDGLINIHIENKAYRIMADETCLLITKYRLNVRLDASLAFNYKLNMIFPDLPLKNDEFTPCRINFINGTFIKIEAIQRNS